MTPLNTFVLCAAIAYIVFVIAFRLGAGMAYDHCLEVKKCQQ